MNQAAPTAPAPKTAAMPFALRLRYWLETTGFFVVIGFFRLFSVERASVIGAWIGRNAIAPTAMSRRALANLRLAFPDKSETEIAVIVRGMWDNLGRVMAEYAHLDSFHFGGANPRIELAGTENLEAARATGKGILLVSGHLANWEIMPFAMRDYGFDGAVVVRPANNPYVDNWIEAARSRNGMPSQIPKGPSGTRRVFTHLRKGESICLLADQRASEGILVPFFGRDAFTTPMPAVLALKLGAVIVPISNERLPGGRFRMRAYPILKPPETGDHDRDVVEITTQINGFIEARIRERPEEWLWIHKRWVVENAPLRKRGLAQSPGRDDATSNRI